MNSPEKPEKINDEIDAGNQILRDFGVFLDEETAGRLSMMIEDGEIDGVKGYLLGMIDRKCAEGELTLARSQELVDLLGLSDSDKARFRHAH